MNKTNIADLAIFGGPKLFNAPQAAGQLERPDRDIFFKHLKKIHAANKYTDQGEVEKKLEETLAKYHGTGYCASFSNANLAIILLLHAATLPGREEVLIPAFTYSGLPHTIRWAKKKTVFCDVDPATHTISPKSIEENLNEKTGAILVVNNCNAPAHIEEITEIARSNGIPVFFDSVHIMGGKYKGKVFGHFGDAEIFSMHATKMLNGFSGGYITTDDADLAGRLRQLRNFGIDEKTGEVVETAFNAKLNELHAAMALASLDLLPRAVERNKEKYEAYLEAFSDMQEVSITPVLEGWNSNYMWILLELSDGWPIDRETTVSILMKENIFARNYYSPPLHLSQHCPPENDTVSLPAAENLAKKAIHMPIGELTQTEDIYKMAEFMGFLQRNAENILAELKKGAGQ